jgi:hypothetical protein
MDIKYTVYLFRVLFKEPLILVKPLYKIGVSNLYQQRKTELNGVFFDRIIPICLLEIIGESSRGTAYEIEYEIKCLFKEKAVFGKEWLFLDENDLEKIELYFKDMVKRNDKRYKYLELSGQGR